MGAHLTHGWYDSNWKYRIPISIDVTAGAGGTPALCAFSKAMPRELEFFWDNVRSDGFDIVLTEWDGITEISAANANASSWDRGAVAFNATTRVCTIRVDGITVGIGDPIVQDSAHNVLWMYFGNSAETTDHTFGTWAGPATETARISSLDTRRLAGRIIRTSPEQAGATLCSKRIAKMSTETDWVFLDFTDDLFSQRGRDQDRKMGDCIRSFTLADETGAVAGPNTVVSATAASWLERHLIQIQLAGGTDGTDYTIKCVARTAQGRILDRRFVCSVNNPAEV